MKRTKINALNLKNSRTNITQMFARADAFTNADFSIGTISHVNVDTVFRMILQVWMQISS